MTASPQRQAVAREDHPDARIYSTYRELWDSHRGIDLVVLSTPPDTHVEFASQAFHAGAAVVVDKGFDLDEATAVWARLPAHQRPRELAIVETMPLLPNGKPDRRAAATFPRQRVGYR